MSSSFAIKYKMHARNSSYYVYTIQLNWKKRKNCSGIVKQSHFENWNHILIHLSNHMLCTERSVCLEMTTARPQRIQSAVTFSTKGLGSFSHCCSVYYQHFLQPNARQFYAHAAPSSTSCVIFINQIQIDDNWRLNCEMLSSEEK